VTGRGIALNGASSSGKSSIGAALQDLSHEPWLLLGVDTFLPLLGREWLWAPAEGVRGRFGREGVRFDAQDDGLMIVTLGPAGRRLMDGLRTSVTALLEHGHDLILDLVLLDGDDRSRWRAAVAPAEVLWAGVECPLAVLEHRERARGDRQHGLARAQIGAVHEGMDYDVVVDTSAISPTEAAQVILTELDGPAPAGQVRE